MTDDGIEKPKGRQLGAFGKLKGCPRDPHRSLQRQEACQKHGKTPEQISSPFQCHGRYHAPAASV